MWEDGTDHWHGLLDIMGFYRLDSCVCTHTPALVPCCDPSPVSASLLPLALGRLSPPKAGLGCIPRIGLDQWAGKAEPSLWPRLGLSQGDRRDLEPHWLSPARSL